MSACTLVAKQSKSLSHAERFRLEFVWPAPTKKVQSDVERFWVNEGALPESTAQARARELLVVTRDNRGRIAAVSTAVRTPVAQLGFDCFYYRTYVGQTSRTRGLRSTELVWDILRESYRLLNQRFAAGYDREVLGIYAEIENPSIMRNCCEATWRDHGANFVFIGRTSDGKHKRIWYFESAKIP